MLQAQRSGNEGLGMLQQTAPISADRWADAKQAILLGVSKTTLAAGVFDEARRQHILSPASQRRLQLSEDRVPGS